MELHVIEQRINQKTKEIAKLHACRETVNPLSYESNETAENNEALCKVQLLRGRARKVYASAIIFCKINLRIGKT